MIVRRAEKIALAIEGGGGRIALLLTPERGETTRGRVAKNGKKFLIADGTQRGKEFRTLGRRFKAIGEKYKGKIRP